MKKIIPILLVILSSYVVNGQSIINRAFPNNTVRDWRFMAGYNLYVPRYNDTTQANIALNLGIDSCGAQIFTYNVNAMWYRQCSPKKWVLLSNGNAPVYTADRGVKIITGDVIRLTDTVEGAGTKFQWVYDKKAFRAGSVTGTEWNIANIGINSFAGGSNNIASGNSSTSFGLFNTASASASFAVGGLNVASNTYSIAMGESNVSSAYASLAIGNGGTASGQASSVFNLSNVAAGNGALATGISNYMNTLNGAVFGAYNDTTGYYANNPSTQVATDPIFVIGNGSGVGVRANAFEMLRNGATKFSSGITTTTDTTTFKPTAMDANGNLRKFGNWGIGAWSLTGNAGTVDGTNFIGTTDNIAFNIKVNNQKAGRISNTLANTFMGYQAGNSNTTGLQNTIFGHEAFYTNTIGYVNDVFGSSALYSNVDGNYNTAVGSGSLYKNTSGLGNVGVGFNAGRGIITGIKNTAIGIGTLYYNSSGSHNTAVGDSAYSVFGVLGSNNSLFGSGSQVLTTGLTNATAIGYKAAVNQSNSLILGSIAGVNGATVDANIGIGTVTPGWKLHVVGTSVLQGQVEMTDHVTVSGTLDAEGLLVANNGFTSVSEAFFNDKITVSTGPNPIAGTATLVAGTVTVNTNKVATNSIIFLTKNTSSGSFGSELTASSADIVNGVSFVIKSNSLLETSTVNWFIINQ